MSPSQIIFYLNRSVKCSNNYITIKEANRFSSSFRSCNLLDFFMRWSLSKENDWKRRTLRARTWDTVTKDKPVAYSLSPKSTIAFNSVSPWLLCTVIAHARLIGSCKREQTVDFASQVYRIGNMGISFLPSIVVIAGPV